MARKHPSEGFSLGVAVGAFGAVLIYSAVNCARLLLVGL